MNTDITNNDVSIAKKMGITQQQYDFWKPYIDILDDISEFYIVKSGGDSLVKSTFYFGMDLSLLPGGEIQIPYILNSANKCRSLIKKENITLDELHFILYYLPQQIYDEVLAKILVKFSHCLTDKEHWEIVTTAWCQQELNSESGRVENWKNIFNLRKPLASLKRSLPEKLTIYRAGHPNGMSWTRKKEVAEWFANRWANFGIFVPIVKRKVKRSDVLFYTNQRQEHEVVII